MSIVLDENKWARDMIESKTLGKKPLETLRRVARYYLDCGYKKKEVRRLLEKFLLDCDPSAPLPRWSDALDKSVDRASKYIAINIPYIDITDKEVAVIKTLPTQQLKRLAFTLLCLAKYWDKVIPNGDHWINSKDSYIMKLANINTSIKRQSYLLRFLNEQGLIQFSRVVDNTNMRVLFIEDGATEIRVSDFRNLGYQYMMYEGGPYFKCENCGLTSRYTNTVKGTHRMYCVDCAVEIATKQRVNSVMRRREQRRNNA